MVGTPLTLAWVHWRGGMSTYSRTINLLDHTRVARAIRPGIWIALFLFAVRAHAAGPDVLSLKHGRYVNSGTPCAAASIARIVAFDASGLYISGNGCKY